MDSSPKLSGDTLIVHHIPLVHCQGPGRQCCGSIKHPAPFCPPDNLGLTRTTSLPERDVLPREALVYSSLIQTSSSSSSSGGGRDGGGMEGGGHRGGSVVSDSSSFTSNNSEEPPLPLGPKCRDKGNPLRHNPFLLNAEDEEEDDDGDNLNGYLEDSSFHLHGNSNGVIDNGAGVSPFHLHDTGYPPEPFLFHGGRSWCAMAGLAGGAEAALEGARIGALKAATRLEGLDLSGFEHQHRHGSSGSTLSMDCGEQEWGEEEEEEEEDDDAPGRGGLRSQACSCSSSCDFAPPASSQHCCCCYCGLPEPFPEPFPEGPPGYGSDSSCNSSDGVLVNFSAIYNKMNNGVPAKPLNLNSSAEQSCASSSSEPGGAFYLDLHASPTSPEALDANCNSYHLPCDGLSAEVSELTACLQSQTRLAAATQNYYKLVTCDLSSQSSPSPASSSIGSCSEEPARGSSPTQASEYYLFRRPEEREAGEAAQDEEELSQLVEDEHEGRRRRRTDEGSPGPSQDAIDGQLYVNVFPPAGPARSRSYDPNLERPPFPRPGSLERMLSCPVRLGDSSAHSPAPAPPRVTSFAEIARSKKRNGPGGSPSPKAASTSSQSQSSQECSPGPELSRLGQSHSLPPMPFHLGLSQGGDTEDCPGREPRTKAEGGWSSSADVIRYSKDQRPTTLPIQPFTFQHQVGKAQAKPLRPLLSDYVSQMYSRPTGQPAPDSVRPSPLGSYSPVRLQGAPSSGTCSTCSPSSPEASRGGSQPPRSLSCPLQAGLLPVRVSPGPAPDREPRPKQVRPPPTPPGPLQKELPPPVLSGHCLLRNPLTSLPPLSATATAPAGFSPLGKLEPTATTCTGPRSLNAHHLSPQALKWREYRRKNPLGVEKAGRGSCTSLSGSQDTKRGDGRLARRNVFDFPASSSHGHAWPNGQCVKQLQHYYSELFPDYFSLTEKPPEEFCLSPDAASESISIDLLQKRGLVKAINTSVDLIVAHFSTSRDPGVKAKLGNSSVSPNVGHLILKYLCPAVRDVLQDGLRAYVLDLIIGQRRNQPWSIVEASTQLGPSTRMLHSLYSKVSQYSELNSHSMRHEARPLNLRSLEFWFHHLYTHEDIVAAHYHPWGFLALSQGMCQPLFEELLLLLQPLSLLPFDLDLLFEPRLLQRGREHLQRKEQLRSAGQELEHSVRSTFQLMRGWGAGGAESRVEGAGSTRERTDLRPEGSWPRRKGAEPRREREGLGKEGVGCEVKGAGPNRTEQRREGERWLTETGAELWRDCRGGGAGRGTPRVKGVGGVEEDGERRRERGTLGDGGRQRDRNAGWWYQLMQSSQIYIDSSSEGSKFVKWEKRKRPTGESLGGRGADPGAGRRQSRPPLRVGVVEGAEASQQEEGTKREARGKPSWMGSPPESVLGELKRSREKEPEAQGEPAEAQGESTQALRWGRLFGAGVGSSSRSQGAEHRPQISQGQAAFRMAESGQAPPPAQQPQAQTTQQPAPREVRALCHHIATQPGQLSFSKGDVLRVLSHAQSDWLLCTLGDREGLVPLVYVTLNEESRGPQ
ncbi:hypothetical protein AAFF_G00072660 [Aldrovandia affinis]|uniref:RUN and SH3 domain containing 2 n=1 Tax=Aldrovandia affinis TaxID=143900 RepID=A0AAD7RYZ4_9TELE|nr:hypothetical protein AAFF_G00072660 [Aldrovandia affinis]